MMSTHKTHTHTNLPVMIGVDFVIADEPAEKTVCVPLTRCVVAMNVVCGCGFTELLHGISKSGVLIRNVEATMRNRLMVFTAPTDSMCLTRALASVWRFSTPDIPFQMPTEVFRSEGAIIANEQILGLPSRRVKRVVIDAPNYLSRFFPTKTDPWFAWDDHNVVKILTEARRRVHVFCTALKASGVEAIFVFDCGQTTDEAVGKWESRRIAEVESGVHGDRVYNILSASDLFFKAFLKDSGAAVLNPEGIDGDDAVISVAQAVNGFVMSRDGDMTRYDEFPTHRVLVDFVIEKGVIVFERRRQPPFVTPDPRKVQPIPIDFRTNPRWIGGPGRLLDRIKKDGFIRRGNVDGLTARYGNLCAANYATKLRAAIYYANDINGVVEYFPEMFTPPGHKKSGRTEHAYIRKETCRAVKDAPLLQELKSTPRASLARLLEQQPTTRTHACAMMLAEWKIAHELSDTLLAPEIEITNLYAYLMEIDDIFAIKDVHEYDQPWCSRTKCCGIHGGQYKTMCGTDLFPSSVLLSHEKAVQKGKNFHEAKCAECVGKLGKQSKMNFWKRAF